MAGTPAPEEEDTEYFDASSTMKSFAASPEWRSGGPPALSTMAQFNKKEERRREREEREAIELRRVASSFKARKMPNFSKKPFSPVLPNRKIK